MEPTNRLSDCGITRQDWYGSLVHYGLSTLRELSIARSIRPARVLTPSSFDNQINRYKFCDSWRSEALLPQLVHHTPKLVYSVLWIMGPENSKFQTSLGFTAQQKESGDQSSFRRDSSRGCVISGMLAHEFTLPHQPSPMSTFANP